MTDGNQTRDEIAGIIHDAMASQKIVRITLAGNPDHRHARLRGERGAGTDDHRYRVCWLGGWEIYQIDAASIVSVAVTERMEAKEKADAVTSAFYSGAEVEMIPMRGRVRRGKIVSVDVEAGIGYLAETDASGKTIETLFWDAQQIVSVRVLGSESPAQPSQVEPAAPCIDEMLKHFAKTGTQLTLLYDGGATPQGQVTSCVTSMVKFRTNCGAEYGFNVDKIVGYHVPPQGLTNDQ